MGFIKKTFLGIICCIFSICLMSQNIFAIEYDVNKTGNFEIVNSSYVRQWNGVQTLCPYTNQSSYQGGTRGIVCSVPKGQTLSDIQLYFDRVIPEYTIVNLYFYYANEGFFNSQTFPIQVTNTSDMVLLDIENGLSSTITIPWGGPTDTTTAYERQYFYKITLLTKVSTTSARLIFSGTAGNSNDMYIFPSSYIGLKDTSASVDDIKNQLKEDSDKHDQEINDQQNAVDDSKNSSNESQSDVNNSTSSLIDVLTQIIGAFTSASASSCVITMSYEGRFSQPVDLCSLDPPLAITSLLSIVVVFILFKFASSIINKIVSLIRSFQ